MDNTNEPKEENNQIVDVAPAPAAEQDNKNPLVPSVSADESTPTNTEPSQQDGSVSGNPQPGTAADTPVNDGKLPAPGMPTGHKAGGPIVAIAAAIIVAIGLAAVTVYAYVKMQNEQKPAASSEVEKSNTQPETTPAQELDAANDDVDNAINQSDEAEFDETELTDESLGL